MTLRDEVVCYVINSATPIPQSVTNIIETISALATTATLALSTGVQRTEITTANCPETESTNPPASPPSAPSASPGCPPFAHPPPLPPVPSAPPPPPLGLLAVFNGAGRNAISFGASSPVSSLLSPSKRKAFNMHSEEWDLPYDASLFPFFVALSNNVCRCES
ncbi:hypothetical protein N7467_005141 [Penicillium canescens]|nr:hypothetical protein N7467_005141 [Penicillium canescens]